MLHDLILALSGYPGDIFKADAEGSIKVRKDVAFPFLHPGETVLMDEILEIATMYLKLQDFISSYQLSGIIENKERSEHQGLYVAALCSGVEELLEDYEDAIAEFEINVIQDVYTTLSNLRAGVEHYRFLFESLLGLVNKVLGQTKSSTVVVEIVKLEYDHKLHLQDKLKKLIPWINRTLYKQITSWIVYGTLADPFNEFFIQQKIVGHVDEGDANETQNVQYFVNYSIVPSHFTVPLMEKILFVGNAILILQKSDRTKAVAMEQQKLFHDKMKEIPLNTFRQEALNNAVQDLAVSVGKVLHKLVVVDANLGNHLGIVKDFYLTGRGELFHDFLESVKHVPLIKNTLQSDFRRAFSTSAVRVQVQDDVMQKIVMRVSADGGGTLVDCISKLSLRIKHEWPLQVFFTEEAEAKYNQLLRFLLKVRLLQMNLNQIWVETKKVFRFPIAGGPAELKNVMSFFIDHLQHYLQEDVLENQYSILTDAIGKSDTFEEIRVAHGNFQSAILTQSFQTNKRVNHFVEELLAIGYKFTSFMQNHITRCERENLPVNEGITKEIQELSANFKLSIELLLNLLKTMASNPQTGTYLGQFLLRLDFNSYFSSLTGDLVSKAIA